MILYRYFFDYIVYYKLLCAHSIVDVVHTTFIYITLLRVHIK
jgi:hypothetical protein